FKRHDGHAVTTEDFVDAMSDASGVDLGQFKVWYDQNGTPKLKITSDYNEEKKEFSFTIEQSTNLNNDNYEALHIPFVYGLISKSGEEKKKDIIHLKKQRETFVIKNIDEEVVPSWNRNFHAPIIVQYEYTEKDLAMLMAFDTDNFNRYESAQKYFKKNLLELVKKLQEKEEVLTDQILSQSFKASFKKLLTDKSIDKSFLAFSLEIPSINALNNELKVYDFDNVNKARKLYREAIGKEFNEEFNTIFSVLNHTKEFDLSVEAMGERALKSVALSYIIFSGQKDASTLATDLFDNANNMTDEIAGLKLLHYIGGEVGEKALSKFYEKWKNETLIMQKWLTIQTTKDDVDVIDDIQELENSDIYDKKVPNLVRSLIGGFAVLNPVIVNHPSGAGYKFLADRIIEIDKYNPQIASRIAKSLSYLKKLDTKRQDMLKVELKRILETKGLSENTLEIVQTNLGL
ncbi:hypothetical protein BVX95_00980, partial [archaeon D22]